MTNLHNGRYGYVKYPHCFFATKWGYHILSSSIPTREPIHTMV